MAGFKDKLAFPTRRTGAKNDQASGTEKELQRLRRVELLELLLDEISQNEQNTDRLEELIKLNARLEAKVDEKDEQISRLISQLDDKDRTIAQLQAQVARLADSAGLTNGGRGLEEIGRSVLNEYRNAR